MALPSVTYSFTNSTTADATEVNTNFTDLINSMTDGTKSFTIDALTAGGTATFNGAVTLGNSSSDDITVTGSLASDIPIKTTDSYDIGSATKGLQTIYIGTGGTETVGLDAPASVSSSFVLTLPDSAGTANADALATDGSGNLQFVPMNLQPGQSFNVGLAAAQTSVAADSISITGANGTAFSSSNPGYICVHSQTAGQNQIFKITADVDIDLTGAHWGFGTNGDLTGQPLSVLALNDDSGTLKWGVAQFGGRKVILGTEDDATGTNINLWNEVLVNSALTSDAAATHVGWFNADFDDTDGSSEDLWTVQTGLGDINLGPNIHTCKQTLYLAADDTATGTPADMQFTNLRVGDVVKIEGLVLAEDNASGYTDAIFTVNFTNNSVAIVESTARMRTNSATMESLRIADNFSKTFTLAATSIIYDFVNETNMLIRGSGTQDETHYSLEIIGDGTGRLPKDCIF